MLPISIPPLSVITMIFSAASIVVGVAMLFLVVWQAPKRRENLLMGFFMLTVVIWGAGTVLVRLAGVLGRDATLFAYINGLVIVLNALSLFAVVAYYAGGWRSRTVRWVLAFGALIFLGLWPLQLNGRLYHSIIMSPEGYFNYEMEPIGYLAFSLIYAYYAAAVVILWRARHTRAGALLSGSVVLSAGIVTTIIPGLDQLSLDMVAAAVACIFFASAILRENLFYPMAELNRALAENEARLRTVITNAPIILWASNLEGEITLLEGKGLDASGITPGNLLGKSIFELYPHAVELEENARKAVGGETFTYIVNAPHLTYETRYSPLRDDTGKILGVIGVSIDVTERKQVEAALLRTEEKYRTILENIEDGFYEVDLNGNVTTCNDAQCRILGYPREEIMGANFRKWAAEGEADHVQEIFTQVYKTGEPAGNIVAEIITKDGRRRMLEFSTSLIRDTDDSPIGFRGIVHDVTERKQAERQVTTRVIQLATLREVATVLSQELDINKALDLALEAAIDFSDADAGFIGLVEDKLVRVVKLVGGYSTQKSLIYFPIEEGIVGRTLKTQQSELILDVHADPDYLEEIPQTRAQMTFPLVSGDKVVGVVNLETAEPARFNAEVFDFLRLLAVHIAISLDSAQLHQQTQAQLEELREIYGELRQLEAMKTEMIRIASHDLRNPISTMFGYLNLLHLDIYETLSEAHQQFMDAIEHNVERMQNIVDDILSLERIEQAAKGQSKIMVNLNLVVTEAYKASQEQAALRAHQYEVVVPELPVMVEVDPLQIKEAITNLISNALKYTPEKGRVTVRLTQTDSKALVEVQDSGYGIPAHLQNDLFQPFFRAQTTETHEVEGTGLGLHLVKSIVERHQGKVIFHSVHGEGSTFGFELPLIDGDKTAPVR